MAVAVKTYVLTLTEANYIFTVVWCCYWMIVHHWFQEELAEGLHLIDFEQLKIENQTYNEKIEERNEVRPNISTLQEYLLCTEDLLANICAALHQWIQHCLTLHCKMGFGGCLILHCKMGFGGCLTLHCKMGFGGCLMFKRFNIIVFSERSLVIGIYVINELHTFSAMNYGNCIA